MHRNGYKGKKFGREKSQREALLKGLAESLILQESIETTVTKAKEVVPYVEKLITKAKKGDLHNRRMLISDLNTVACVNKLVDEIAPKLSGRTSGYFRIKKTSLRRGDNVQMARISFVDDLKAAPAPAKPAKQTEESPKKSAKPSKKPAAKAKTTKKAAKK